MQINLIIWMNGNDNFQHGRHKLPKLTENQIDNADRAVPIKENVLVMISLLK